MMFAQSETNSRHFDSNRSDSAVPEQDALVLVILVESAGNDDLFMLKVVAGDSRLEDSTDYHIKLVA